MAAQAKRAQVAGRVLPSQGTCEEALSIIFAPIAAGNGFRHGALGAPGYGKTHGVRWLIREALRRNIVDLVVTHDVKDRKPEFPEGLLFAGVEHLAGHESEIEASRHVVIRGDPMLDVEPELEPVALKGKALSRAGLHVALNVAELDNALTEGGRSWRAPTVRWFSSQGRMLRACLLWTTQQPKRAPDEMFDQSTSIALHQHEARSANYLADRLSFDEDLVAVLPNLTLGEFVLREPGRPWNRKVYRFPEL